MEDLKALTECAECTWDYIDRLRMALASACKERDELKKRLSAYEDTGLEPEEIERIVGAYGRGHTLRTESAERLEIVREIKTDRLRELAKAEKDGRLVVLPCKVGDTVWVVFSNGLRPYVVDRLYVMADSKVMVRMRHMLTETLRISEDNFGKTAFLTKKEAEMAQKGYSE